MQTDSQAVLGANVKMAPPVRSVSRLTQTTALELEVQNLERAVEKHYRGIINI